MSNEDQQTDRQMVAKAPAGDRVLAPAAARASQVPAPEIRPTEPDGPLIDGGWVGSLSLAGDWLAVGGLDGEVRLLSRTGLDLRRRLRLRTGAVQALAVGPDGRLYVGGMGGEVLAYAPGQPQPRPVPALGGVEGAPISALVSCAESQALYVADLGGAIRAFDANLRPQGALSTDAGEEVYDLVVDSRRERLYVITPAGVLRLAPGAGTAPEPLPGGAGRRPRALAKAGAGRWLAASGDEPGALLWDLEAGGGPTQLAAAETLLALAADGDTLYGGGSAGHLYAWDLANGTTRRWDGHRREVSALAVGRAQDGTPLLASGGLDREVHLWRLAGDAAEPLLAATLKPVADGFLWQTPAEPRLASDGLFYSDRPERHIGGRPDERRLFQRANHWPELVRARVHDWARYQALLARVAPPPPPPPPLDDLRRVLTHKPTE